MRLPEANIRSEAAVGEDLAALQDKVEAASRAVVVEVEVSAKPNVVVVLKVQHATDEWSGSGQY